MLAQSLDQSIKQECDDILLLLQSNPGGLTLAQIASLHTSPAGVISITNRLNMLKMQGKVDQEFRGNVPAVYQARGWTCGGDRHE